MCNSGGGWSQNLTWASASKCRALLTHSPHPLAPSLASKIGGRMWISKEGPGSAALGPWQTDHFGQLRSRRASALFLEWSPGSWGVTGGRRMERLRKGSQQESLGGEDRETVAGILFLPECFSLNTARCFSIMGLAHISHSPIATRLYF